MTKESIFLLPGNFPRCWNSLLHLWKAWTVTPQTFLFSYCYSNNSTQLPPLQMLSQNKQNCSVFFLSTLKQLRRTKAWLLSTLYQRTSLISNARMDRVWCIYLHDLILSLVIYSIYCMRYLFADGVSKEQLLFFIQHQTLRSLLTEDVTDHFWSLIMEKDVKSTFRKFPLIVQGFGTHTVVL